MQKINTNGIQLTEILLFIFIISSIINILYWILWFDVEGRTDKYQSINNVDIEGVSIVICTKNALEQLKKNLVSVLTQKYPLFEVIVVDDDSKDESRQWLNEMKLNYDNLHILELKNTLPGKKQALKYGISNAQFNWVLLTDADCYACSDLWIYEMMEARMNQTQIVLGYSPYISQSSWLNKMIRFETFMTAVLYFSAAVNGMPYMGVGRNVLYHKDILVDYDRVIRYEIPSGDDDMLINEMATNLNVSTCLSKNSIMYSQPELSWKAWIVQKTRHISTSYSYNWKHKLVLILFAGSQVGSLAFYTLLLSDYLNVISIILVTRWIVMIWRSNLIFDKLDEISLWKYLVVLDIGLSFYYLLIHPLGYFMNWGNKGNFIQSK